MGPQALDDVLTPRGVAIFGASDDPHSVGGIMLRNLIIGGYEGNVAAINPRHRSVAGQPCYERLRDVPGPVELGIAAAPAANLPDIVDACVERGVRAVLLAAADRPGSAAVMPSVLARAARGRLRVLGPNSLGVMRPSHKLNATFSWNTARPGPLAIVSQSGALCTSMLDWAAAHRVGLSAMISLGDAADVDFGDVLDSLALDGQTQGILLYVERIQRARAFLSGLKAAARMKPVVIVKSGRHAAPSDADDAFDAALARTGAVRAETVEQLFAAGQLLATGRRVRGSGLAIVTNARGLSVLAADRAKDLGVTVAPLAPKTQAMLEAALPAASSHTNPVDLLADATAQRYVAAVEACLADPHVHGVLAMLAPQAFAKPLLVARGLITVQQRWDKVLLACFVGESLVDSARTLLLEHGIPELHSPEAAVESFAYLARHERNHQLLLQAPGPIAADAWPDARAAETVMTSALARGAHQLSPEETGRVLAAYGVPMADAGSWPRADTAELYVRVVRDAVFGPVVRFGLGPAEDSPIREHFVGLPPLHAGLVRAMLRDSATEASLTAEQRRAIERLIWGISELIAARPEVTALRLRPVFVDARGGVAGGATVQLAPLPPGASPFEHMAIHPYPSHLQATLTLHDGERLTVRPIRPEDAEMEAAFVRALSPRSRFFRFLMNLRELTPDLLVRFTQIDYDRELALVAIDSSSGADVQVAVARYGMNPNQRTADFAIVVADAWHGRGLGKAILQRLLDAARSRGIEALEGEMRADNENMRHLMRAMGFTIRASPDDVQVLLLERSLRAPPPPPVER